MSRGQPPRGKTAVAVGVSEWPGVGFVILRDATGIYRAFEAVSRVVIVSGKSRADAMKELEAFSKTHTLKDLAEMIACTAPLRPGDNPEPERDIPDPWDLKRHDYLTPREVAAMLGCHQNAVSGYYKRGMIERAPERFWYSPRLPTYVRESVESYARLRGKIRRGPPSRARMFADDTQRRRVATGDYAIGSDPMPEGDEWLEGYRDAEG